MHIIIEYGYIETKEAFHGKNYQAVLGNPSRQICCIRLSVRLRNGWQRSYERNSLDVTILALEQIYSQTNQGFIYIIDEWDCVFRIAKERKGIQKNYLDFLRGLFKGAEYVELAYMTGILPIKKYGEHSALNIFKEYSMVEPKNLGEYYGFTEEEAREPCQKQGVDYAQMERWYDGYRVGGLSIYNPKPVVDALEWKEA